MVLVTSEIVLNMNVLSNLNFYRRLCVILMLILIFISVGFFSTSFASEATEVPNAVKTVVEEMSPALEEKEEVLIADNEVPLSSAEVEMTLMNVVIACLGVFVLLLGIIMFIGNRELNRES